MLCCSHSFFNLQQELKDELEDAKYLFEGVELTEKEKADLRWGQRRGVWGLGEKGVWGLGMRRAR